MAGSPAAARGDGHESLDLAQLRDRFRALDRNGDGLLSRDELAVWLTQNGMDSASAAQHASNLVELGGGSSDAAGLRFADFVTECVRTSRFQSLRAAQLQFKRADTNGDGVISKEELRAALVAELGEEAAASQVDVAFAAMDRSGAGFVDREAFAAYHRLQSAQLQQTQRQ